MNKFILMIAALGLTLGLMPSLATAHSDPDANKWKIASVRWIKANLQRDDKDIDAKWVVLIGKVTEQIDADTYRLNDGTGNIVLDVDGIKLPVGKRVVVRGEIDEAYWDIGTLEVNVESWRLERK